MPPAIAATGKSLRQPRSTAKEGPTSLVPVYFIYYAFGSVIVGILVTNIFSITSALEHTPTPPTEMFGDDPELQKRSALGGAQHITISPTIQPRTSRIRPPAEQRLYSYLFGSPSYYLKHVRPVIDHATTVEVRLGVCIMTIDDIVEKDQTMLSTGCVKMKWVDEVLQWDPDEFDNLTWIVIPSTEIWLPDIALVNSPDPFQMTKKMANVELSYNGEVGYYPSGRFTTRCPVSLTYFPFDAQLCELQFESWAYPVQQLRLIEWLKDPVDMKSFVTNHQWRLDGVNVHTLLTTYDGFNFSTIRFHFFFHRRSLYYTVYAVYPCLLMAALQLFSHTLPVEHPGRMALLTSLFIGSSVVQSSITASMPKSSDGISVIQVYLMLYSASLLVSIIITSVNMHIFYRTPDDSSPGIVPLVASFLLTFGIRPMQKTTPAEASATPVKAPSPVLRKERPSDSRSSVTSLALRPSQKKRASSLSKGEGPRRRRSSNRYPFMTLSAAPSPVRHASSDAGSRNTENCHVDMPRDSSTMLKSLAEDSHEFNDDASSITEPRPPPPEGASSPESPYKKRVVKSQTTPFMHGQVSSSTAPKLGEKPPEGRLQMVDDNESTDWMDTKRCWSLAPPPLILTGQSPTSSMNCVLNEEDERGSSDEETAPPQTSLLPKMHDSNVPYLRRSCQSMATTDQRSSTAVADSPDGRRPTAKSVTAGGTTRAEKMEQATRVRVRHAWLTYAAVIDKFFFYSMGIINFIAPIILFLVMPAIQQYPGGVSTENMIPSPDAK